MLAFTTLAVSAALASTVIASSHDSMGHRDSHQGRLKLNKLKANHAKRESSVHRGGGTRARGRGQGRDLV
jgi:hypothetical protein